MSNKATHFGTCQICGHRQKLPNGRLSRHGYTKRWGFFYGTCPGAGYLPFEQSTGRIEAAIASALFQATALDARAATIRAGEDGVWFNYYESYRNSSRKPGYYWTRGRIDEAGNWVSDDGKYSANKLQNSIHNVPKWIADTNGRYARSLEANAAQLRDYADWQNERVASWKPADLIPIAA